MAVDPSEPAAPSLAVPAETGTSPAGDESQPPAVDMQAEDVCAHEPEPVKPEETDMEGPEGTKKYRCTHPGCNKEIAGLWNAKNHRRTVHNSGPYEFSCEPCRTWYKRKGDLKRHLVTSKNHTNGEKFHCAKCKCCYLRESDLMRHCRLKKHAPKTDQLQTATTA